MVLKDGNGSRTKHIALRFHMIKELVLSGQIVVLYRPSEHMTSDILTKSLGPTLFLHLRDYLLGTASILNRNLIDKLSYLPSVMNNALFAFYVPSNLIPWYVLLLLISAYNYNRYIFLLISFKGECCRVSHVLIPILYLSH